MPVLKRLCVMRCLHFARAAILARVKGFGKNVVPFFGFWIGCRRIRPQSVKCLRENRDLSCFREFCEASFIFHGQELHLTILRTLWGVTLPEDSRFVFCGLTGLSSP
jgi:hypothetical protein